MMKKQRDAVLDEMQNAKLLKLEATGLWLTFWLLTAAIVVQALLGFSLREIAGEFIVLLIASVYIAVSSVKNGLWTRDSSPSLRASALASLIPAFAMGAFVIVRSLVFLHKPFEATLILRAGIYMLVVYALCFASMEIMRRIYRKRLDILENADEEDKE
ncbi:MAG: hypothetical protein IJU78_03250 [Clostridia bacterium]|nr:hypothetical protein [Clostridia bacterium]